MEGKWKDREREREKNACIRDIKIPICGYYFKYE
jgi:hypothetical protein